MTAWRLRPVQRCHSRPPCRPFCVSTSLALHTRMHASWSHVSLYHPPPTCRGHDPGQHGKPALSPGLPTAAAGGLHSSDGSCRRRRRSPRNWQRHHSVKQARTPLPDACRNADCTHLWVFSPACMPLAMSFLACFMHSAVRWGPCPPPSAFQQGRMRRSEPSMVGGFPVKVAWMS